MQAEIEIDGDEVTINSLVIDSAELVAYLDDYEEDARAETDLNVVVSGDGRFIEVQGTAEGEPFDRELLNQLLDLAVEGCKTITTMQKAVLKS